MPNTQKEAGLGDINARFKVYIANRPNFADFQTLQTIKSLSNAEITAIGKACGNGWRKVFNVYAKLVFALNSETLVPLRQSDSWQGFRDNLLLSKGSNTSLLFTEPKHSNKGIQLVMGKTYAKSLGLSLEWINHDFAIEAKSGIIVCPYFDYRQLSNIKIITLVELIKQQNATLSSSEL
ncbi:DUF6942 family protein [Paraglaciecola sp. 2405UD69-4]|uniref:DUF6942 family protein n=1 Tax=Paraglaciecola sp. 2405UD69-4 TaxID=3391836 RepID=UPI0039C97FA7